MNTTPREILHAALVEIRKEGPDEGWGICLNVEDKLIGQLVYDDGNLLYEVEAELGALLKVWPKFSGDPFYPIPGNYHHSRLAAGLWDKCTDYGQLRWELLDWLIEQTAPGKED